MEFLNDKIMPIALIGCLVLGYLLKKWMPTDNRLIPTILAIVGAVIGCLASKTFDLEPAIYGALTGLASTGLHQMFKQYVEMGEAKALKGDPKAKKLKEGGKDEL